MKAVFPILPILLLAGCASKPTPVADSPQPAKASVQQASPVTVPQGTVLHVRLAETLDTKRNRSGDRFTATLDSPVNVAGNAVIPKGAKFSGRIDTSAPSGRLKGRAVMNLSLDAFELNGKRYDISTSHASRVSGSH